MSKSHEGEGKPPEQEKELSVTHFIAMKEERIREFEAQNRERIISAPLNVREQFDSKWRSLFGVPYFQPVTVHATPEAAELAGKERLDPKSSNYKGHWEVTFSPKGNQNDPNDVTLSVNGYCLQIKRGIAVILPGPFLECADHTVYPQFKQLPGEPRKVVAYVKQFPYTVHRKATGEEYMEQKTMGDRITREIRDAEEKAV